MAFKTDDDIAIEGTDKDLFVFVKFVLSGGTPSFTLYKDAAETDLYTAPHDLIVPVRKTCAVYFWLTANSHTGSKFSSTPCDWGAEGQPSTVSDGHMRSNRRGFSLMVNNWSPHTGDNAGSFKLVVEDDQGNPHTSQEFEVDPTIIEKGDPLTY